MMALVWNPEIHFFPVQWKSGATMDSNIKKKKNSLRAAGVASSKRPIHPEIRNTFGVS